MAVGAQVLRQTNGPLQDLSPAIALCLSDTLKWPVFRVCFQSPPTFRRDSNALFEVMQVAVYFAAEARV